ncbi:MAG: ABC transporter substrate-binding protein [Desulfuromonadales bacterium]|nr:ABC transporter substrate-binding protein [Desulfuromonadales bacterium]
MMSLGGYLFVKFRLLLLLAAVVSQLWVAVPSFAAEKKFMAVVITGGLDRYREAQEAFEQIIESGGMKDKIQLYVQMPNPDPMSWANTIRKAVGVGADLIVTYGAPATLVAMKESSSIPIVFADVYDPVALNIVKDLNITGGNITGVSSKTPVETLVAAIFEIKKFKKVGILYTKFDQGSVLQSDEFEKLLAARGAGAVRENVVKAGDVAAATQTLAEKADLLFVSESAVLHLKLDEIIAIANAKGIPVVSQIPHLADHGALVTLAADSTEQGRLLGVHTIQILNGQKALTLPVRTPRKVALTMNLKAAKLLHLTIPFQALSMATEVVQ